MNSGNNVHKDVRKYRNGVAYVNATLAAIYGKDQIKLYRGDGNYYFMNHEDFIYGEGTQSIYSAFLDISTDRGRYFVESIVDDVVRHITAAKQDDAS